MINKTDTSKMSSVDCVETRCRNKGTNPLSEAVTRKQQPEVFSVRLSLFAYIAVMFVLKCLFSTLFGKGVYSHITSDFVIHLTEALVLLLPYYSKAVHCVVHSNVSRLYCLSAYM